MSAWEKRAEQIARQVKAHQIAAVLHEAHVSADEAEHQLTMDQWSLAVREASRRRGSPMCDPSLRTLRMVVHELAELERKEAPADFDDAKGG